MLTASQPEMAERELPTMFFEVPAKPECSSSTQGSGESEAMTTGLQSANLRLAIESDAELIITPSASGLRGRAKDEDDGMI